MKIFQMNDCDWWIGESLKACAADCVANYSDEGVDEDARELTETELDTLKFVDDGERRTFREQLAIEVAKGGKFPRMFASTEY